GIVGRFGGEEFIVYLQDTDRNDALKISQLLLYVLHEHRFDAGGGNSINITVSIGLCSNQFHSYNTIDEMIQHADEQLYIAKNNGRDQVSICS
ncbi:GGDEF domain-containing protein, partial [Bacillus haikouensis]|uniref:GGDEF domain-containing protein n=1 Tax=Bacillus haikouensis TaxID=1510468 RepID=UPI0015553327